MGIDVPIFSPKEMLQFKIEFAEKTLTYINFYDILSLGGFWYAQCEGGRVMSLF
jgi:hypothetical protein